MRLRRRIIKHIFSLIIIGLLIMFFAKGCTNISNDNGAIDTNNAPVNVGEYLPENVEDVPGISEISSTADNAVDKIIDENITDSETKGIAHDFHDMSNNIMQQWYSNIRAMLNGK